MSLSLSLSLTLSLYIYIFFVRNNHRYSMVTYSDQLYGGKESNLMAVSGLGNTGGCMQTFDSNTGST